MIVFSLEEDHAWSDGTRGDRCVMFESVTKVVELPTSVPSSTVTDDDGDGFYTGTITDGAALEAITATADTDYYYVTLYYADDLSGLSYLDHQTEFSRLGSFEGKEPCLLTPSLPVR